MCFAIVPHAAELGTVLTIQPDHGTMAIFHIIPQLANKNGALTVEFSDEAFISIFRLDPSELGSFRIQEVHLFIKIDRAIGLIGYADGTCCAHCFAEAMLNVVFPLARNSRVVCLIARS